MVDIDIIEGAIFDHLENKTKFDAVSDIARLQEQNIRQDSPFVAKYPEAYSATIKNGDEVFELWGTFCEEKEEWIPIEEECKAMCVSFVPSQLVEYKLKCHDKWLPSSICYNAYDMLRGAKYAIWRKNLLECSCKRQLKSMLKVGLVTKVYDSLIFPIPDEHREQYTVIDQNDKKQELPCPLVEARVWDIKTLSWENLPTRMLDAPSDEEVEDEWKALILALYESHGESEIQSLFDEIKDEQ